MHFTTLLLTAFASTLAYAAPAASNDDGSALDKRWPCKTAWPLGVSQIDISKKSGQASTQQWLTFAPPASAVGACSLVATFPANYPINNQGNAQVNVYDGGAGPAPGALVGTITFASETWGPKLNTINSFACRPQVDFRLEMAGAEGSTSFAEGNGAGIALTYDC